MKQSINEFSRSNFRLTVNRSYYSVSYAMRAFLAILEKDSSKPSGVISLFNQYLIKPGIVSEFNFKAIQSLMDLRHEGDYQDFAEITKEEAECALETAKSAITALKNVMMRLLIKQ